MEEVKPKNIFETPQGDERLGWTGDAEIFCRTACFLENTYSFYRKWLRDVEADQTEEGGVAHVVPDIISGNEGYNWLLEQGSHSAAARRFKIPGNTVEFVRDLRYNKYRVFTELRNEQKKKGKVVTTNKRTAHIPQWPYRICAVLNLKTGFNFIEFLSRVRYSSLRYTNLLYPDRHSSPRRQSLYKHRGSYLFQ